MRIVTAHMAAAVAVCLLVRPASASAQASLQVPLEFDFLNPGARSLALGSAFTGLADDATAAFTNPAGLLVLRDPEISFELRARRHETSYLQGGRLSGPLTGRGIDTIPSAVYGTSVSDEVGPSYFSVIYPRGRWTLAGYRHAFVRLAESFEAQGVFQGIGTRELALRGTRALSLTTYGVSTAFQAAPRFRVGGGVTVVKFQLDSTFERFGSGFFEAPTYSASSRLFEGTDTSDDIALGFNAGGLYTAIERASGFPRLVQIGAVFRRGAAGEFATVLESFPQPAQTLTGSFKVPDQASGGVAIRFNDSALLAADVVYVRYANLKNDYIAVATALSDKGQFFDIDDATEVHLGFEYALPLALSPVLRIGTWYDPAHAVRYRTPAQPDLVDERYAAYLPGTESETHVTFGGGATVSRWLEINAGADLAGRKRVVSVSAVVRFPR